MRRILPVVLTLAPSELAFAADKMPGSLGSSRVLAAAAPIKYLSFTGCMCSRG